jgi:zinc protease
MRSALLVSLALLVGCAPRALDRSIAPSPLPTPDFAPPAPARATLSNGVQVVVSENHEVPLVGVRIAFVPGGFTDPAGKEGLAASTMDMLNEGAGAYDAAGLASALEKLGMSLSTGAGSDGASVAVGGLKRNLGPGLDLLKTVLREPTFPAGDWELLKKQQIAGIAKRRKDPESIASRVFERALFGDAYTGRAATEASLEAITLDDMRAWWVANVQPQNAIVFVGGDTTLAEIVPLLEARLGDWKPTGAPVARPTPQAGTGTAAIHFVDRPGAAQSIVRVGGYVGKPQDPDWFDMIVANTAVGGQFTARLNMNLREEKGWTYGARSSLSFDLAGGRLVAGAGIHTEHTVAGLQETWRELAEASTQRPLTEAEIAYGRDALAYGRPLRYESADFLLDQEETIWRYQLPADWTTAWTQRVRGVTQQQAQQAWRARIDTKALVTVVVGDAAVVREPLRALGLPLIEHDADGNVLSAPIPSSVPTAPKE